MYDQQEVGQFCFPRRESPSVRATAKSGILLAAVALLAAPASGQIAKVFEEDGKRVFVNSAELAPARRAASSSQPQSVETARRAALSQPLASENFGTASHMDRELLERMVHETAERHRVDPALVRAVIEAESNWNPAAVSRKGALGLMQLVPGTAKRFGVGNAFNPQQNLDAGVRYLRTLLERYDGNLIKALAAYNAGEGVVDRAGGVPSYRETRHYVQKITDSYFRSDSRAGNVWGSSRPIYRAVDERGKVVFTNE